MSSELPLVVVYEVATADGRVAFSPDRLLMDDPRWQGIEHGGYGTVLRRYRPEALLEGAGTFVLPDAPPVGWDEPDGEVPVGHFLPEEVVGRTDRWLAVTDSRGRIRWGFKEIDNPDWEHTHVLVLVSRTTPRGYLAYLIREHIPYLVVGVDRVDLTEALATLRSTLGVTTVAATCGARLGGALLRAGLIDRLEIEILPLVVGGTHTPQLLTAPDLPASEPPAALHLDDATVYADGRVLLSYATRS